MMCSIKRIVKNTIGVGRCLLAGVTNPGGIYVGRHVHFINSKKMKFGSDVQIRPDVDLFAGDVFVIGNGCDIGTRNRIVGDIVIEDFVLFGPDNYICSQDHSFQNIQIPIIAQGTHKVSKDGHTELRIGEGSWIGTHVAIIGCVHIGQHCVIGANAVVTRDVPDYCVVVGNPAKIVRRYDFLENKWKKVV